MGTRAAEIRRLEDELEKLREQNALLEQEVFQTRAAGPKLVPLPKGERDVIIGRVARTLQCSECRTWGACVDPKYGRDKVPMHQERIEAARRIVDGEA